MKGGSYKFRFYLKTVTINSKTILQLIVQAYVRSYNITIIILLSNKTLTHDLQEI